MRRSRPRFELSSISSFGFSFFPGLSGADRLRHPFLFSYRENNSQFYRNVDTVGAGENFKTRIDVLELEETLAVVRVLEEGWGGKINFTDVLLLLKIDVEWKCVAKAYNQNSNTIEK